jgi:hypothetical protein
MQLIFRLTIVLFASLILISCSRHGPPEDVIRTFCEEDLRATIKASDSQSGDVEVKILEITRQSLTESKKIRGIPDDTWVYAIGCSIQTTIGGIEAEPVTHHLYFFRDSDGGWHERGKELRSL